jgi:hypothetical protein
MSGSIVEPAVQASHGFAGEPELELPGCDDSDGGRNQKAKQVAARKRRVGGPRKKVRHRD